MNKIVLGIGEIVWDCLPGGRKLGGAPVNFAYHCKEPGAESYPVSAVGNDALGDKTLQQCMGYGLCTDYIDRNPLPTSRVIVTLDAAGVPSYEIVENVAWDALEVTPKVKVADTVGAGDCFTAAFITSILNGSRPSEAHAKAVSMSAWLCTLPGAINSLKR